MNMKASVACYLQSFFSKMTQLVNFESHSNLNLTLMINMADGYFFYLWCFKSVAKMNSLNN